VRASAWYDPALEHRIFVCPTPGWYDLFAAWQYRSRGVTMDFLNGNIFIGPSSLERNEVYGPSGRSAGADRPMSYFLAHEMTHHLTSAHLGRLAYARLAPWQREGYADYVARGGPVDLAAEAMRLRAGDAAMDPQRSGLYLRYRLEVAFLLDHEHLSVEQTLAPGRSAREVDEAALRAFP
jgi:hypothetical protein